MQRAITSKKLRSAESGNKQASKKATDLGDSGAENYSISFRFNLEYF